MTPFSRRAWRSVAAAALFALCFVQVRQLEIPQERGVLDIDPPTPYVLYQDSPSPTGTILLVHGLDSSKEFLHLFAATLTDAGFKVYAIDLPGHGDSSARFNALTAQTALSAVLDYLGPDTAVMGHSLGAGLLLDLATQRQFRTMVLFSPPPTPLDKIRAERLLVVTGDWDMPRINAFIPMLKDVSQGKAEWRRLAWVGHSSAVFNPAHTADVVRWLGGNTENLKSRQRLFWAVLQLLSSGALGISLLRTPSIMPRRTSIKSALMLFVLGCAGALVVCGFYVVATPLRLFATDYLVGFLFVAGCFIYVCRSAAWSTTGENQIRARGAGMGAAVLAAAYAIFVMGFVGGSQFFHLTLSDGRWWRFPFIAVAVLPVCLFDELVLRPIYPRWKSVGAAVLSRALLGLSIATGVLMINTEDAFLVLIIHLVVLFWLGLWFATELIHRHTQNPYAAALFAALIQGWAFAAVFVLV